MTSLPNFFWLGFGVQCLGVLVCLLRGSVRVAVGLLLLFTVVQTMFLWVWVLRRHPQEPY